MQIGISDAMIVSLQLMIIIVFLTDTGTTFAKLFQVEGIQTILFKFWAFRVYTLNNLTPIRLFCVKGRFSGLSGIKTDHVWPEIQPLGFKGLILIHRVINFYFYLSLFGSCFLAAWAISKSALVITHERPKLKLPKQKDIYPSQCSARVC